MPLWKTQNRGAFLISCGFTAATPAKPRKHALVVAFAVGVAAGVVMTLLIGRLGKEPQSAVVQSWDFEQDHGGFGAHVTDELPVPSRGVKLSCQPAPKAPKAPSGSCSLEVLSSESQASDVYVAAGVSAEGNTGTRMTAQVAWANGTSSCNYTSPRTVDDRRSGTSLLLRAKLMVR